MFTYVIVEINMVDLDGEVPDWELTGNPANRPPGASSNANWMKKNKRIADGLWKALQTGKRKATKAKAAEKTKSCDDAKTTTPKQKPK